MGIRSNQSTHDRWIPGRKSPTLGVARCYKWLIRSQPHHDSNPDKIPWMPLVGCSSASVLSKHNCKNVSISPLLYSFPDTMDIQILSPEVIQDAPVVDAASTAIAPADILATFGSNSIGRHLDMNESTWTQSSS